ncbi:hypothetical protein GOP47_0009747 [Adiantum capillus-veneris]|uniref:Pentatricopeptide repeat-containing protein n=1 Tax=Adiantum capillus-veneris TaxID=13818 RepID=A0A9D4ZJS5_ADICA|nr:hypothetical protein GOP47_0009747 [Adiantum capillus-veneris]
MAVLQSTCVLREACLRMQTHHLHLSSSLCRYGSGRYGSALLLSARLSLPKIVTTEPKWAKRKSRILCSFAFDGDPDATVAAAIYEVEVMVREPQEVLDGMRDRLSAQDLQLILLYFSQAGRDAWYALEVFDWMQGTGRAGEEARDLMMSVMFKWLMHLVSSGSPVEEVRSLLQDMTCVGLLPDPDILQALACAYWDRGSKDDAIEFALNCMTADDDDQATLVALMWRMLRSSGQREAMELARRVRVTRTSKISFRLYNVALLAAIAEQQQLTRTLRDLRAYQQRGMVGALEDSDKESIRGYEKSLHAQAEQIASWALEEHQGKGASKIYQKLLAMYCVAGDGLEAMRALWCLRLTGKSVHSKFYNVVLGICAYGNHQHATRLILNTMKEEGPVPDKTSYTALFGGFANGGHADEAIRAVLEMLDQGFLPDRSTTVIAMKQLSRVNDFSLIRKLSQRLVEAELVDPFVLYVYIDDFKLRIIFLL